MLKISRQVPILSNVQINGLGAPLTTAPDDPFELLLHLVCNMPRRILATCGHALRGPRNLCGGGQRDVFLRVECHANSSLHLSHQVRYNLFTRFCAVVDDGGIERVKLGCQPLVTLLNRIAQFVRFVSGTNVYSLPQSVRFLVEGQLHLLRLKFASGPQLVNNKTYYREGHQRHCD